MVLSPSVVDEAVLVVRTLVEASIDMMPVVGLSYGTLVGFLFIMIDY